MPIFTTLRSLLTCAGLAGALAVATGGMAQALEKITVVQSSSTTLRLPFYIALQNGYFKDEGLDMEVVNSANASAAMMMMVGGQVDFTIGQVVDSVNLHKNGKRSMGVAMLTSRLTNNIILRKGLANEIKSIRDLKGRPFGVLSVGSGTWQFALLAGLAEGMKREDFLFLSTGGGANVFGAIRSGRVDALSYGDPENLRMVLDGDATFLVDATDDATHAKLVGNSYVNNQVMFMESYIQAKPNNVQAVVNAIQRALNWTRTHSPEDVAKVLVTFSGFNNMDVDVMARVLKRMHNAIPATAVITREAFDNAIKAPMSIGVLDAPMQLDNLVINRFAEAAAKKYPPSP